MKHDMVDAVVTTAGGIEEDFMKCFAPHFVGDFELNGNVLFKEQINRLGNLLGKFNNNNKNNHNHNHNHNHNNNESKSTTTTTTTTQQQQQQQQP